MLLTKVIQVLIVSGIVTSTFADAQGDYYYYYNTYGETEYNTLRIEILYEALCPDSKDFMKNQLGPSYDSLKNKIHVTLVPFGKAYSLNNGALMICQHGKAECEYNRKQSCVLAQTKNQEKQVKFVVCQISVRDKSSIHHCARSVGLSDDIDFCMNSQQGTQLQKQAQQTTMKYFPEWIPTVVYEGKFDEELQERSLSNFREVVCELLRQRGTHC